MFAAARRICPFATSCATKVAEGFTFDKVLRPPTAAKSRSVCYPRVPRYEHQAPSPFHSTADADALHAAVSADLRILHRRGPASCRESYLNDDAVLTCAVSRELKGNSSRLWLFFREGELRTRLRQSMAWRLSGPSAKVIDKVAGRQGRRTSNGCRGGVPITRAAICSKSPEEATAEAERIGPPCAY